ncbi:hypothetical protein GCM10025857_38320 [Alicyclobacillus contaminans]|nr:hypothetical protein GCM10025857_38320 [Alicyclobacillus contaminans]
MDHPIQGLMKTAMENIREMVDVNTIIGDPVETPDGTVILPVSRVGFGFAAGGANSTLASEALPMAEVSIHLAADPVAACPSIRLAF